VSDAEKFTTARLAARSWRAGDLPLAMELWGDPAVTALIDARDQITEAQVEEEKLRAEIDRERSDGVQYWALFDRKSGDFVGCGGLRRWIYTPAEANFELGFHLVKRCWGRGFATEAAQGALDYGWRELPLSKVYAGHHPDTARRNASSKSSASPSWKTSSTSRRALCTRHTSATDPNEPSTTAIPHCRRGNGFLSSTCLGVGPTASLNPVERALSNRGGS